MISLLTNLRKIDNKAVTKIKRRITLMIIWEDWEENEIVQNNTISDRTQESEREFYFTFLFACEKNV